MLGTWEVSKGKKSKSVTISPQNLVAMELSSFGGPSALENGSQLDWYGMSAFGLISGSYLFSQWAVYNLAQIPLVTKL